MIPKASPFQKDNEQFDLNTETRPLSSKPSQLIKYLRNSSTPIILKKNIRDMEV